MSWDQKTLSNQQMNLQQQYATMSGVILDFATEKLQTC